MKLSTKILLGLIAGSILVGSPSFSQKQEKIKKDTKKELVKGVEKKVVNDGISKILLDGDPKNIIHDSIIKIDINDILEFYGQEKGMDIINQHFLIEINKLRKSYGVSELQISNEVVEAAQKQSEYLNNSGKVRHAENEKELGKKLETINFDTWGYNLARGQGTINELIEDWLSSPTHKANLLSKNFKEIGLGYINSMGGIWVLIFIG